MALSLVLFDAFHALAAGTEMDGRTFVKCLRDAALFDDEFTAVDADLVFTKCKSRAARKIDFFNFAKALREVAKRRDMSPEQVQYVICLSSGPDHLIGSNEERCGPERFFYDTSLYTGTHRNGGPSLVGSGTEEGERVTFEKLVNRDRSKELGRRHMNESDMSISESSTKGDNLPKFLGKKGGAKKGAAEMRGPERFFYDKSSYTGTHRNGGPDANGNGLKKEGYSDLSEVVNRDHLLDDDLNRRRRRAAAEAEDSLESSFGSTREGLDRPTAFADPRPASPLSLPRLLGSVRQPTAEQGLDKKPAMPCWVAPGQLRLSTPAVQVPVQKQILQPSVTARSWYGASAPMVIPPMPTPRETLAYSQRDRLGGRILQ